MDSSTGKPSVHRGGNLFPQKVIPYEIILQHVIQGRQVSQARLSHTTRLAQGIETLQFFHHGMHGDAYSTDFVLSHNDGVAENHDYGEQ